MFIFRPSGSWSLWPAQCKAFTEITSNLGTLIPLCLWNQFRLQCPNNTTLWILHIHYTLLQHVSVALYGHHQVVLQKHKKGLYLSKPGIFCSNPTLDMCMVLLCLWDMFGFYVSGVSTPPSVGDRLALRWPNTMLNHLNEVHILFLNIYFNIYLAI